MLDFMAWNSLPADLRVLAETRPSGVLEVLEVAALGVGGAAARRERFLQGKAKARKLPTSVLADLCKALEEVPNATGLSPSVLLAPRSSSAVGSRFSA